MELRRVVVKFVVDMLKSNPSRCFESGVRDASIEPSKI